MASKCPALRRPPGTFSPFRERPQQEPSTLQPAGLRGVQVRMPHFHRCPNHSRRAGNAVALLWKPVFTGHCLTPFANPTSLCVCGEGTAAVPEKSPARFRALTIRLSSRHLPCPGLPPGGGAGTVRTKPARTQKGPSIHPRARSTRSHPQGARCL